MDRKLERGMYSRVKSTDVGAFNEMPESENVRVQEGSLSSSLRSPKVCALTLIAYSALVLLLGYLIGCIRSAHQKDLRLHDFDSPIFNLFNAATHRHKYNNTFWPGENPSIFRQPPSDAVDDAWDRISNGRDIIITREQVLALGNNPDETVRADPSWGFGEDAHLGLIHAMHQNHCLNTLRKAVYYNHYYRHRRGFGANPPMDYRAKYYAHVDHCIDFLRQDIACKADLTISTYRWMEGEGTPEADFNTWHQCRDFEALLTWHQEHEINAGMSLQAIEDRWNTFRPKQNDLIVPQEPEADPQFWNINEYAE